MQRWIYILFSAVLMIFLASCSSNEENNAKDREKTDEEQGVNVDKGLLNVEITLPASMFEGEDIDTVIADAKKEDIKVTKNEDGSLTYKMSKAQHKKMMNELETSIVESIEETKKSDDYVSIKDITYNNSFTEFTMVVDKKAFEDSMDGFAAFGLGMQGAFYQMYNGEDPDHYKVTVFMKDEATDEVFDKMVFPDDLEEEEETTE